MKQDISRWTSGLLIAAALTGPPVATLAAAGAAASGSCGKGFSSESADEPRGRSWHGLAVASMLDVILPSLAERVASVADSGDRTAHRRGGLAKAERGLLAGVLSAAVSAGLAALGDTLEAPTEPREPSTSSQGASAEPAAGSSSPCSEGDGTL